MKTDYIEPTWDGRGKLRMSRTEYDVKKGHGADHKWLAEAAAEKASGFNAHREYIEAAARVDAAQLAADEKKLKAQYDRFVTEPTRLDLKKKEWEMADEGIKHDDGKPRWDLLPPSLVHVVEVYTIGAKKYDDHNWAKGMGWSRIFRAMMSHAWKWFWGQEIDPEDGQRHLASVAWCALTLMQYVDDGIGNDDRRFTPLEEEPEPVRYEAKPYTLSFEVNYDSPLAQEKSPEARMRLEDEQWGEYSGPYESDEQWEW